MLNENKLLDIPVLQEYPVQIQKPTAAELMPDYCVCQRCHKTLPAWEWAFDRSGHTCGGEVKGVWVSK